MGIRFATYAEEHIEQVRAFNGRLRAGGMTTQFPTHAASPTLPPRPDRSLFQEYFLALDAGEVVRGGYVLKHQEFQVGGRVVSLGDFQLPISEGAVDRNHAALAGELLFDALKRKPLLFGLGMGGYEEPITRLHKAAGFRMFAVPFFFKVNHPFRFCRRLRFLRRRWPWRLALDAAAFTGTAWLGVRAVQAVRTRSQGRCPALSVELVPAFASWADELWSRHQSQYRMIAVRTSDILQILYPPDDPRFLRLKVSAAGQLLGWCLVLDTQMQNHKQFGTLRVGSLVDAFAAPEHAAAIVRAATRYLEERGVDLIVSNQSHAAWCRALDEAGYFRGPSNFLFSGSKRLTRLLADGQIASDQIYVNRGDGDGPNNL